GYLIYYKAQSSPPSEESPQGEVVRKFVVIPNSLTTPAFGHPSKGVELHHDEFKFCLYLVCFGGQGLVLSPAVAGDFC
ncbi:MAG: hypothetical protein J6Y07_00050, partial [Alphaproteobacteria bacterium]|nr:hypothetical protein [Alphaproteobacteria bacterium]